jgi:hypothetical protein
MTTARRAAPDHSMQVDHLGVVAFRASKEPSGRKMSGFW